MKVGLVTAVWRRHDLTRVFWQWTALLRAWWSDVAEVVPIAAGSDDPVHERMAADAGAEYVNTPNTPLGRKFNMTLKIARGLKVDAVLIMGSDDLFCETTAEAYKPYLRGVPYVGLQDLYYYHVVDGRAGYHPGYQHPPRTGEPAGCGRLIPAAYLQRLGWRLWTDRGMVHKLKGKTYRQFKNHGMDHSSFRRMAAAVPDPWPMIRLADIDGVALDCKGQGNLWRFEHTHCWPLPEGMTADRVLGQLPASLRDGLMQFQAVAV